MSHGVRTIVRTQTGPPGKDGEVTAIQLAAHAVKDRGVHGITVDTTVGTRVMLAGHMVYGDTGQRSITPAAATAGAVSLRRHGATVALIFDGIVLPASETSWYQLDAFVPAGFRPRRDIYQPAAPRNTTEYAGVIRVVATGTVYIYSHVADAIIRAAMLWMTDDAWPASLPGTPA